MLIKKINPYKLRRKLKDYIDTSNYSSDAIFPLKTGENEKCFGCLKFESGECPCKEYNAKVPKTFEEKRINQLRSIKAIWLKRGFKQIILDDDFKSVTPNEKPRSLT